MVSFFQQMKARWKMKDTHTDWQITTAAHLAMQNYVEKMAKKKKTVSAWYVRHFKLQDVFCVL